MIHPEAATMATAPETQDLTGRVISILSGLGSLFAMLFVLVRTRDKRSDPTPADALATAPGAMGRIHERLDEMAKELGAYKVEVAEKYATSAELTALTALLADIDKRARRTETILRIVFRKQLADAGAGLEPED